jgi:hypothetical protein
MVRRSLGARGVPPTHRIPHVLERSGTIVAILRADPLEVPPPGDHTNKILAGSLLSGRAESEVSGSRFDGA